MSLKKPSVFINLKVLVIFAMLEKLVCSYKPFYSVY